MTRVQNWLTNVLRWFDSTAASDHLNTSSRAFNFLRVVPFIALHLACLLVIFTGTSTFAVVFAAAFFAVRMFAITGFYHRYFAHKTFKTSRVAQFLFGVLGASAAQRGPLWWAAHHRHHHQHSDDENDLHSPHQGGFWWSHVGWFTCDAGFAMKRRFETDDDSRNNVWLALITMGEGWHNNHHRWPQSVRQGFRWYEVDMTWYGLWILERMGIIWDMNPIPKHIQEETRQLDAMRRNRT